MGGATDDVEVTHPRRGDLVGRLRAVEPGDLVEAAPPAGPGLPLLVGPGWPSRLRSLQNHPGRWGRWPGRSTTSARASATSAARHAQGLAGSYTLRTSTDSDGGILVAARWTPPAAQGPACRVCGCTEERACLGGCEWVEEDLCSACGSVDLFGGLLGAMVGSADASPQNATAAGPAAAGELGADLEVEFAAERARADRMAEMLETDAIYDPAGVLAEHHAARTARPPAPPCEQLHHHWVGEAEGLTPLPVTVTGVQS